jgi:hypothetical protein
VRFFFPLLIQLRFHQRPLHSSISLLILLPFLLAMPLTESGRAFWSLDETEALLAAAPRWGFSAAKLRENVAQLSHFSTKQVSSKLADLQIQNRSGSRAAAMKKRNSKPDRNSDPSLLLHEARGLAQGPSSGFPTSEETSSDPNYEPMSPVYSESGSPLDSSSSLPNLKKRERSFVPELSPPEAKRQILLDARMQHRNPYPFANASGLTGFGPHTLSSLAGHLPCPSNFAFPPGLMLPPLLGLPPGSSLFPNADKLLPPTDPGSIKRAIMLKEGFQAPPGTKPSLVECPHPFIRCYSSPDVFKIVINPILIGTTVDILVPQEPSGHCRALLKIDWKLAATPFDADFDFRRHPSLTELYLCPLPSNVNNNFTYLTHQTQDAMCLIFALDRPIFSTIETAIAALSTLAAASSSSEDDSSHSSTVTGSTPTSSAAATPMEDAPASLAL